MYTCRNATAYSSPVRPRPAERRIGTQVFVHTQYLFRASATTNRSAVYLAPLVRPCPLSTVLTFCCFFALECLSRTHRPPHELRPGWRSQHHPGTCNSLALALSLAVPAVSPHSKRQTALNPAAFSNWDVPNCIYLSRSKARNLACLPLSLLSPFQKGSGLLAK